MDYSALIGRKVFQGGFKGNGEGTIVSVEGEIISVDFGGVVKKFSMEIFIKSLKFDNDETRELMEQAIDEAKEAKAAAEKALAACNENGVLSASGFMMRYHAYHQKMKELISVCFV